MNTEPESESGEQWNARTVLAAHGELPLPSDRSLVMGILNVTPDSFSDGGAFLTPGAALRRARQMVEEGADWIDIGGESTRPGARPVSVREELRRTIPVIERLAGQIRAPISIDTCKAEVADQALAAGAAIVNDVTALRGDPEMVKVVSRHRAAVILMHMKGTPRTMQRRPVYGDVIEEITSFLTNATTQAVQRGVPAKSLLIDPGLGFGKQLAHNLTIMHSLSRFVALGYPVVIGPSRKSFIGLTLDAPVEDRLAGTLACVAAAMRHGVHVVRVHDVRATAQCLRMLQAIDAGQLAEDNRKGSARPHGTRAARR